MSRPLDADDRRLLHLLQAEFPLEARPYAVLGARLGLSEEDVAGRVARLRESGVIRRLGANFDSRRLGCASTLAAASVPPDRLEMFVKAVNARPEVTHNYLRDHRFNVWFTIIAPDMEQVEAIVAAISRQTGIEVRSLPATRLYKIRVDFSLEENDGAGHADSGI